MKKLAILSLLLILSACEDQTGTDSQQNSQASTPLVLTSNYPLYYFASEIGGDAVDVQMPEMEGDPAMWVPGADDVAQLQTADLIVINGAGYESWLAFTSLDAGRLLDTTGDIQDRLLPIENVTLHQHGPEGEHSHAGHAFTTWLDPNIAKEQARAIARGLSTLLPEQAESFGTRLALLEEKLDELDNSLKQAFSDIGNQPLVFSHPVYQYLQMRYGLNARSVHWEPDTEPGIQQWLELQNLLGDHRAELMVWEGAPMPSVTGRLEEMGIRSIVFDPAGNRPDTGDYMTLMSANISTLLAVP